MSRRVLALQLLIASLMGCHASGVPADAGSPDSSHDAATLCLHVDGRGGPAADGSAAAPFATIDDALLAGATSMCLSAGMHTAPSQALNGILSISGVSGDPERPDATVIEARGEGCVEVRYPGPSSASPAYRAGAGIRLSAGADVSIADLRISGCELGVFVGAGSLTTTRVFFTGVTSSVVVSDGGRFTGSASTFTAGLEPSARFDDPTPPFAVYAVNAAALRIKDGSTLRGRSLSVGLMVRQTPTDLSDTLFEGSTWGFLVDQGVGSGLRTEVGTGTLVRGLLAVTTRTGVLRAGNLIRGGLARLDGTRFEGVEGDGLQLVLVDDAQLTSVEFSGCTHASLALFSASAELSGDSLFDIGDGEMGLYLSPRSDTPSSSHPSSLRVTSTLVSSANAGARHAVIQGSSLNLMAGARFTGGSVGVLVEQGASLDVVGEMAVSDLTLLSGVGSSEHAVGVTVRGLGSVARIDSVTLEQVMSSSASVGLLVRGGGSLTVASGRLSSFDAGAFVDGASRLTLDDVEIDAAGGNGVAVLGGTATLTGVRVHDGAGVGVLVRDGATLSLDRAVISNNGGSGVEAQAGSRLEIRGSTFEANVGAGVAFYDASGFVASSMFSVGSVLGDFGGAMRADEVRVVSTDGASHQVIFGDDGDGTVMPDEENRFELEARAGCAAGGCTLVLGDGAGANGVVNPNCIVASAPGGAVHTVVGQNGASMSVIGGSAGTAWADALGGMATDLGLSSGSPGVAAAVPSALTVPTLVEITPPF